MNIRAACVADFCSHILDINLQDRADVCLCTVFASVFENEGCVYHSVYGYVFTLYLCIFRVIAVFRC